MSPYRTISLFVVGAICAGAALAGCSSEGAFEPSGSAGEPVIGDARHIFDPPPIVGGRGQRCGGFAGFVCPRGQVCVDDPSDNCDPNFGGADCGGYCRARPCIPVVCAGGMWNPQTCSCGFEGEPGRPIDCSVTGCPPGQYCTTCWSPDLVCIPVGAMC